jgi:hypothetical protein
LQAKRQCCSWLNARTRESENHIWGEEEGLYSEREARQAQGPRVSPWWANRRTHGRAQQFVIPQPWLEVGKKHVNVMGWYLSVELRNRAGLGGQAGRKCPQAGARRTRPARTPTVDSSTFGSLARGSLIHGSSNYGTSHNGKHRSLINSTTRAKSVVLRLPLGSWVAAAQKARDLLTAGFSNDELNRVIRNFIALAEGFG